MSSGRRERHHHRVLPAPQTGAAQCRLPNRRTEENSAHMEESNKQLIIVIVVFVTHVLYLLKCNYFHVGYILKCVY